MKNAINTDLIREIALKTVIYPAFIEKNWYTVQLFRLLNEFENDLGVDLVFSGGTSLSKGFGLIKTLFREFEFYSNRIRTSI